MKKYDVIWGAALLLIIVFLISPVTHGLFVESTKAHPYILAFIKFAILATMGELLALRIINEDWKKHVGLLYRGIVWGFLGMVFVIVFEIFSSGVVSATKHGLLPSFGNGIAGNIGIAFLTSAFMNLLFAPTFMAFHRITDTFIDLGQGKISMIFKVPINAVVKNIDWTGFISFVVCRTLPVFWIPAHTITFLLPSEYRVIMAAFLSIALGGILAFAKKRNAMAS
jgi:hypothetical protein